MEKLIEMANAGVGITMFGPNSLGSYQKNWHFTAKRVDDGITLEISSIDNDCQLAIDDLYEKWVSATRGLPNHGLRQIEHTPPEAPLSGSWVKPEIDDEIPF